MPVHRSNGLNAAAVDVWQRADAVCFDVDSTLIREEAIDKLAEHCGVGKQVAEWTKKAMGGSITFRDSLRTRLNMIKPRKQQLQDFIESQSIEDVLTPGVTELISMLHNKGTTVYLVSGGFRRIIEYFANYLAIPTTNIYANRLLFSEEGDYIGFDENEPTSQSGGKPMVVTQLKKKHEIVVMIGDGATDLEASPPADTFIGFGGNVVREKVKKNAPWFIYSFQDLIDALEQDSIQQQRLEPEMNSVSESGAIGNSPMHYEEIKVEAS